jgi:hypothetical protein
MSSNKWKVATSKQIGAQHDSLWVIEPQKNCGNSSDVCYGRDARAIPAKVVDPQVCARMIEACDGAGLWVY